MEKGTQKFLAIILSIALLFCFPIVSQADENIYKETFKGTYTAPESARNVLVSGNDATVSEWYGDRVNIGGHTYSVRQNEYGLNKDGNMIKMDLNETYTIWLAQYGGVASFIFTAPSDGRYLFSTSENATYAPYMNSLYNSQYSPVINPLITLTDQLNGEIQERDCGWGYYDKDKETRNAQAYYDMNSGQTVYLAASGSEDVDTVYDISVSLYTKENCSHDWEDIGYYYSPNGDKCQLIIKYECKKCGSTKDEVFKEYEHSWDIIDEEYDGCLCTQHLECGYCGATKTEEVDNHEWDYINGDWSGCNGKNYYKCAICAETKEESLESHNWNMTYTHQAQNCLDISTGTKTCDDCGKTEPFEEKDGKHTEASRELCHIGYWDIEYICTCALCGEEYWVYENTPCEDSTTGEIHHSFGNQEDVPCGQTVTCTTCGYEYTNHHDIEGDNECGNPNACKNCGYIYPAQHTIGDLSKIDCYDSVYCSTCGKYICNKEHSYGNWKDIPCGQTVTCAYCGDKEEGWHDYDSNTVKTPLTATGKCYTETETSVCKKCGYTDVNTYTQHSAFEYVQVTPQHDNVCGTYNFVCADCGAMRYPEHIECHSYINWYNGAFSCNRCGQTTSCIHRFDKGVYSAPTCTANGGTLYTCIECGATKLENVIPSTGHNFGNNSPTCLTCGITNPNYVAPTVPETPTTPAVPETPVTPSPAPDTTVKATALTSLTGGKKKFKAEWKKSENAQGYQLQYSTDKNFKKGNKAVIAKTTSITVSKLKENTKYYVRVRAYKKVDGKKVYTSWSKAQSVITAAPPKAAETSKAKAGKKQFKITWKKSSDAAGYQIQYSTNKNFKKGNKSVTVKGKNTTSVTMKGLKAKKTYYVRVRSYRVVKVKGKATKIYSSWSEVKTVKIK